MYKQILVDLFGIYFRSKGLNKNNPSTIIPEALSFLEKQVFSTLDSTPNSHIWILSDFLPRNTLNFNQNYDHPLFKVRGNKVRNNISANYKSGRDLEISSLKDLNLFRNYFIKRDPKYKLVCSTNPDLEADDFVEPLINKIQSDPLLKGDILLVSFDSDWLRYLDCQRVFVYNLKSNLQVSEFEAKCGFKPTIASITFYKAFLGDSSDSIKGSYIQGFTTAFRDSHYYRLISFLKEIADQKMSLNEAVEFFIQHFETKEEQKVQKDFGKAYQTLFIHRKIVQSNFKNSTLQNVQVIRSRCKEIEKFIHTYYPDPQWIKIIDSILKKNQPVDFKKSFGIT